MNKHIHHNKRFSRNQLARIMVAVNPVVLLVVGMTVSVALHLKMASSIQLVFISLVVVTITSLLMAILKAIRSIMNYDVLFSAPIAIAQNREVLEIYRSLSVSLRDILASSDAIQYDLSLERLHQFEREATKIAQGYIAFGDTETWRTAYERLLRSPGIHRYRSVAYAKTTNYWQNEPGRQSMLVNFEVQSGGVQIERMIIIPDRYWPAGELVPMEPLVTWVDEQHQNGIAVQLVRLSALAGEPDLVTDMGIYGNRAVGFQEINEEGLTTRFSLSFDFAEVLSAEQRWDRLALYTSPYPKALD